MPDGRGIWDSYQEGISEAGKWSSSCWWFQPIRKILVKMGILPNRGENKKYLKPPPRVLVSFLHLTADGDSLTFSGFPHAHGQSPLQSPRNNFVKAPPLREHGQSTGRPRIFQPFLPCCMASSRPFSKPGSSKGC